MPKPRSRVAVIKTTPENILADIKRLCVLADMGNALAKDKTVILKDNISWHLSFLSANTTPWQLEGTIIALKGAGWTGLAAVHNNTVVTDPRKGLRLNKLEQIYRKYGVLGKFNFQKEDMR